MSVVCSVAPLNSVTRCRAQLVTSWPSVLTNPMTGLLEREPSVIRGHAAAHP